MYKECESEQTLMEQCFITGVVFGQFSDFLHVHVDRCCAYTCVSIVCSGYK